MINELKILLDLDDSRSVVCHCLRRVVERACSEHSFAKSTVNIAWDIEFGGDLGEERGGVG
jgi:hypothetical protein